MAKAAPKARELATELDVDIETVQGTGKNGFVLVADVEAAAGLVAPAENKLTAKQILEPLSDFDVVNPEAVVNTRTRAEEPRGVLNHKKDDTHKAHGGLSFKRPDRGSLDYSTNKKLDIPQKYLNNELHYHFVIDDGGRVENLREHKGYASVPNITTPEGDTILTRRRSGTNKDGTPQYQQLMATPKSFYAERKEKAEEERTFKEQGLVDQPTDEHGKPLSTNEYYMHENTTIGRS